MDSAVIIDGLKAQCDYKSITRDLLKKKKELTSKKTVGQYQVTNVFELFKQLYKRVLRSKKIQSVEEGICFKETASLLANYWFLDDRAALSAKDSKVLPMLDFCVTLFQSRIAEQPEMCDLIGTLLRGLSNLVRLKECAYAYLEQTKHGLRNISELLSALVSRSPSCTVHPSVTQKLSEHVLRFLRVFAAHGGPFMKSLLRDSVVANLGRCVVFFAQESTSFDSAPLLKTVETLQCFVDVTRRTLHDKRFVLEILQSDCLPELVKQVTTDIDWSDIKGLTACQKASLKLLVSLSHISELRIQIAKYGFLDILQRLSDCPDDGPSPVRPEEALETLCMYSKDAYVRSHVLDSGGHLQFLVDKFVSSSDLLSKRACHLLDAFMCFQYMGNQLSDVVLQRGFLERLLGHLEHYIDAYPCRHEHNVAQLSEEQGSVGEDGSIMAGSEDCSPDKRRTSYQTSDEETYRPDSPSYLLLAEQQKILCRGAGYNGDIEDTEEQLFRSFHAPPGSMSPGSEPGPSWTPTGHRSSYLSSSSGSSACSLDFSSDLSSGPCTPKNLSDGALSPALSVESVLRAPAAKRCRVSGLDEVMKMDISGEFGGSEEAEPNLSPEDGKTDDELGRISDDARCAVRGVLMLMSWMSHDEQGECIERLVSKRVLMLLFRYIKETCSPDPRAGRILKRIVQNSRFMEPLVMVHRLPDLVRGTLCTPVCQDVARDGLRMTHSTSADDCEGLAICDGCKKRAQIGEDILSSFQSQVDTDFGINLFLRIFTMDEREKIYAAHSAASLIKSTGGKKKLFLQLKGLDLLFGLLLNPATSREGKIRVVESLSYLPNSGRISSFLRSPVGYASQSTTACEFSQCFRQPDNAQDSIAIQFTQAGRLLTVSKSTLAAKSSYFETLLFPERGWWPEVNQRCLQVSKMGVTDLAFEGFLHSLCDCGSDCELLRLIRDPIDAFGFLDLAIRHFKPELCRFFLAFLVPRVISWVNVCDFIIGSLIYRDQCPGLLNFVFSFLLTRMSAERAFNAVEVVRQSNRGDVFLRSLHEFVECNISG